MFQCLQDGIDRLSIYLKRTIQSFLDIWATDDAKDLLCQFNDAYKQHIMGSRTLSIVSVEE